MCARTLRNVARREILVQPKQKSDSGYIFATCRICCAKEDGWEAVRETSFQTHRCLDAKVFVSLF